MARIRTIKPEFFTSEDIVSLSPIARLLYIALWCEADRNGRLNWKPKTFKIRYFPADDCDVTALCDELINQGLIKTYGNGYAYIPSFSAHQHVNPRESASILPEPDASVRVRDASNLDLHAQVGREGEGREGEGNLTEPNGSGGFTAAAVREMAKAELWNAGKSLLVKSGLPEKQCGSFIGKLVKDYGDFVVVEAVRCAVVEQPANPTEYLVATCRASVGLRNGRGQDRPRDKSPADKVMRLFAEAQAQAGRREIGHD